MDIFEKVKEAQKRLRGHAHVTPIYDLADVEPTHPGGYLFEM